MTLRLTRDMSSEIIDHAMSEDPYECVGVIVCHVSTGACRVIRLVNASKTPEDRFEVSHKDVRALYRDLDRTREYVQTVYHSHTRVAAIPSQADVEGADLEDAHYLIVATSGRGRALRSWRIRGGRAVEEPVEIV